MFTTYTGLEYLKIAIANAAGQDKLLFEERIIWFDNNIKDISDMNQEELLELCKSFDNIDSIELLFTGLLAYQDYTNNISTGYRCQLDAVCSGASIMSALTADEKGLDHTGLISNRRGDAYTAVFNRFISICPIECNITRDDIKEYVMQTLYGSSLALKKITMKIMGYNHYRVSELDNDELTKYKTISSNIELALDMELNGAYQLQQVLTSTWNEQSDTHRWVLPDGFTVIARTKKEKDYVFTTEIDNQIYKIPFTLKQYSPLDKGVKNCPNSIHS